MLQSATALPNGSDQHVARWGAWVSGGSPIPPIAKPPGTSGPTHTLPIAGAAPRPLPERRLLQERQLLRAMWVQAMLRGQQMLQALQSLRGLWVPQLLWVSQAQAQQILWVSRAGKLPSRRVVGSPCLPGWPCAEALPAPPALCAAAAAAAACRR